MCHYSYKQCFILQETGKVPLKRNGGYKKSPTIIFREIKQNSFLNKGLMELFKISFDEIKGSTFITHQRYSFFTKIASIIITNYKIAS